MTNKKWYVVENIGDEITTSIVELTDEEVQAVRRFLDNQIVILDGIYGGTTTLYDMTPYDTREDAEYAAQNGTYMPMVYVPEIEEN